MLIHVAKYFIVKLLFYFNFTMISHNGTLKYHLMLHIAGGSCTMRNFIICAHPQISLGQVKANEVGGACGTHGGGEKSVQGFGGKARRKEIT
jgi:hypothetical protein